MTLSDPGPNDTPTRPDDAPRFESRVGGLIILLFFVLFVGWGAVARLDAGAYARGQVSVSGSRQAVQHQEGGTVRALNVAEGDRVQKGAVLMELQAGNLAAEERGVTGQVIALMAQRARLIAERDHLGTVPVPSEFAALPPEDKILADEAVRLQRMQLAARRNGRNASAGVLEQRVGQINEQISGVQRQIVSNVEQQRLIQEELVGLKSLASRGFAPLNRVRALERTAAALDGELGSLRAQVAGSQEAIGQTRLEIHEISTKLNEEVADQLRLIDVQLNELMPRQAQLRSQIEAARVRAPATGEVVGLTAFTIGGVVAPGQTLMEIVPDEASLVIVVSVNPDDIDNLQLGQKSEVKFPGLRERNTPLLHGVLTRVSADSFTDERTGNSYFRAEIVIPAAELAKLGPLASHIRPGMPAETVILLRRRTALQYLIEPLTRSLWRSGAAQ